MKESKKPALRTQIKEYYGPKIKRDTIIPFAFAILVTASAFFPAVQSISGSAKSNLIISMVIMFALFLGNAFVNDFQKTKWLEAHTGEYNGMLSSSYGRMQMNQWYSFEQILENNPKMKNTRFAKWYKKD